MRARLVLPLAISLLIGCGCAMALGPSLDPGIVVLIPGGETTLTADGETVLPIFVRSWDGDGHPDPAELSASNSTGDLFASLDDPPARSVSLAGDSSVLYFRCAAGRDSTSNLAVRRPDRGSAELTLQCFAKRTPVLVFQVEDCMGRASYDGEPCDVRLHLSYLSELGEESGSAQQIELRVEGTRTADGPVDGAQLTLNEGAPSESLLLQTSENGFVEASLLPPLLYEGYQVTLAAIATTQHGVVESSATLTFELVDRARVSLLAFPPLIASGSTSQLTVIAEGIDGLPLAGGALNVSADAAGVLLQQGELVGNPLDLVLGDNGDAVFDLLAPVVQHIYDVSVHAQVQLPRLGGSRSQGATLRVFPPSVASLTVSAEPAAIVDDGAALLTATASSYAAGSFYGVNDVELLFRVDPASSGLLLLDGGSSTVAVTDGNGQATTVATVATPGATGVAVVRVSGVVDGEALEQLFAIEIVAPP